MKAKTRKLLSAVGAMRVNSDIKTVTATTPTYAPVNELFTPRHQSQAQTTPQTAKPAISDNSTGPWPLRRIETPVGTASRTQAVMNHRPIRSQRARLTTRRQLRRVGRPSGSDAGSVAG